MADVSPIVDGVVNPAPLLQEAVEPVAVSLEPAAVPPVAAAEPPAPAASSAAVVPEDIAAIVTVSPVVKANAAREAFSTGDAEASRAMHESMRVAHDGAVAKADEAHGGFGSDYVKSIVFGGLDGIITTFSTIASSVGGNLSIEAVITLGFANLIADAISMGVGDFISSKAEYDHLMAERARELWEFDNHPEGEKQEMVRRSIRLLVCVAPLALSVCWHKTRPSKSSGWQGLLAARRPAHLRIPRPLAYIGWTSDPFKACLSAHVLREPHLMDCAIVTSNVSRLPVPAGGPAEVQGH